MTVPESDVSAVTEIISSTRNLFNKSATFNSPKQGMLSVYSKPTELEYLKT
jgi:hypothetical protein